MGKLSQTLGLYGNRLEFNGLIIAELGNDVPPGVCRNLADFIDEVRALRAEKEAQRKELEKVKTWLEEATGYLGRMIDPPGGL